MRRILAWHSSTNSVDALAAEVAKATHISSIPKKNLHHCNVNAWRRSPMHADLAPDGILPAMIWKCAGQATCSGASKADHHTKWECNCIWTWWTGAQKPKTLVQTSISFYPHTFPLHIFQILTNARLGTYDCHARRVHKSSI